MPDYADDPGSELERKSRALSWMAIVETLSYLVLFWFWIVQPNEIVRRVFGTVHGVIWLAFAAMTVIIRADIGWSWGYVALVIVTGPIGGLLVWERIRRTPRELLLRGSSRRADR